MMVGFVRPSTSYLPVQLPCSPVLSIRFDTEARCLHITPEGPLHRDLILELLEQVAAHPESQVRCYDLRRASLAFLSPDDLKEIAFRGRQMFPAESKIAVIAGTKLTESLAGFFATHRAKEGTTMKVFRDLESARAWIMRGD